MWVLTNACTERLMLLTWLAAVAVRRWAAGGRRRGFLGSLLV